MLAPWEVDNEDENSLFEYPWTAVLPMISGSLSAFGSSMVLRELWPEFWKGQRKTLPTTRHAQRPKQQPAPQPSQQQQQQTRNTSRMRAPIVRCFVALSALDFVCSIAFAVSTIPSPRQYTHIPFAAGTFETCAAQAFWLQLNNVSSPLFSTLLTFYYTVTLKYQWSDTRIQRTEWASHAAIWIVGLVSAIFPIPMELYSNPYHFCWFSSFPQGCERYHEDVPCERGDNFELFMGAFTIFPLWPCLLAVVIMLYLIYHKVRNVEAAAARKPWGETAEDASSELFRSQSKTKMETNDDDVIGEEEEEHWNEDGFQVVTIAGSPANSSGIIRNHQFRLSSSSNNHSSNVNSNSQDQEEEDDDEEGNNQRNISGDRSGSSNHTGSRSTPIVNRRRSRAVARQAFWFVLAFVATHILRLVAILLFVISNQTNTILFVLAFDVMLPLQGWWNALVLLWTRQELHTPEALFLKQALSWRTYQPCWGYCWAPWQRLASFVGNAMRSVAVASSKSSSSSPSLPSAQGTDGTPIQDKENRGDSDGSNKTSNSNKSAPDRKRAPVPTSSYMQRPSSSFWGSLLPSNMKTNSNVSDDSTSSNSADQHALRTVGAKGLYASSTDDRKSRHENDTSASNNNSDQHQRSKNYESTTYTSHNSTTSFSCNSADLLFLENLGPDSLDLKSSIDDKSQGGANLNASKKSLQSRIDVIEEVDQEDDEDSAPNSRRTDEGNPSAQESTRTVRTAAHNSIAPGLLSEAEGRHEDASPTTTNNPLSNRMGRSGWPVSSRERFAVSDLTTDSEDYHLFNGHSSPRNSGNTTRLASLEKFSMAEPLYQDDDSHVAAAATEQGRTVSPSSRRKLESSPLYSDSDEDLPN